MPIDDREVPPGAGFVVCQDPPTHTLAVRPRGLLIACVTSASTRGNSVSPNPAKVLGSKRPTVNCVGLPPAEL